MKSIQSKPLEEEENIKKIAGKEKPFTDWINTEKLHPIIRNKHLAHCFLFLSGTSKLLSFKIDYGVFVWDAHIILEQVGFCRLGDVEKEG